MPFMLAFQAILQRALLRFLASRNLFLSCALYCDVTVVNMGVEAWHYMIGWHQILRLLILINVQSWS